MLETLAGFKPTPHPVLKLPGTAEEARDLITRMGGVDAFLEWLRQREELIRLEKADPYHWGVYLSHWKDADDLLTQAKRLLVLGGNRSAKSKYAARRAVKVMEAKPEARVMCLQTTGPNSVALQQPYVHDYLPPEWLATAKGPVANLKYSRKGGFTENTFVAPNGSQCWFYNYSQDIDVLEGWELDLVWCDELVPWSWIETLGFRLVTRGGEMIVTFTPIQGYTMTIKQICDAGRVTRWRGADLLPDTVNVTQGPKGHMPYVMEPVDPNWRVIFFHSDMNPYGNYPELVKECAGKDRAFVMVRAYGYTEKSFGDVCPLFGAHNIIDDQAVPAQGTNYNIVDPAGRRNWFTIWLRIDPFGRHFVYREWPDVARFGEWAIPSEENTRYDGTPGPAQRSVGYGIAGYKKMLLREEGRGEREQWGKGEKELLGTTSPLSPLPPFPFVQQPAREPGEHILQRILDPRAATAQTQADDDGGTCLLDRMNEEQFDRQGNVIAPAMPFVPGSGIEIEEKVSAINDLLAYDPEKPIEPLMNEPRLYVARRCRNTIWALQNWTGRDGQKGACKDPIDCLGMMAAGDLKYVDDESLACTGGGGY
jgi:hypothetical protein